ncbi:XRE family transcriptional regulator [Pantoea endophytica]|uniref:XRE family transcriptional regulator n=1 Tax=Pantoea endophytica TaxID=92488 RepID=UPI00301A3F4F
MRWNRERAATELGVSMRTYKNYENSDEIKRSVALATVTFSLVSILPAMKSEQVSRELLLRLLSDMAESVIETL